MLDRALFLFAEGFRNLIRHKLTVFAAVFSVFLTMIIIGSLFIIGKNTNKLIYYLRSKYKIEVFFEADLAKEEALEVVEKLNLYPVLGIQHLSIRKALPKYLRNSLVRIFWITFNVIPCR